MTASRSGDGLRLPILMYHSISDSSTDAFREFVVPPRLFAEHLAFLSGEGFATVTARQVLDARTLGRTLPDRAVMLTFDDGFADFATEAFPRLDAAGLTSTLFVATGFVGDTSRWLVAEGETRRRMLSWEALAELADSGVEIGSHSHSHPQLDLLRRPEAARDLATSKDLLQQALQRRITTLAYPFGYSRKSVREVVHAMGFTTAFVVGDLVSDIEGDLLALPRLTVAASTSVEDLATMLNGRCTIRDVLRSRARSIASRTLREVRLKKRANSPGRAPEPLDP